MSHTEEPLRIGIVGTGKIAGVIAGAIHRARGAKLAAVASRSQESAESFVANHGRDGHGWDGRSDARAFGSWRQMFGAEGAGAIDAVYLATPTTTREEIAVAAASAGKHVLAEKPFVSLASVRRIATACRDHGVAFLDATHFVHHPRTARIQQSIRQDLGKALALRSSFFALVTNRGNIRYDQKLEPLGVVGDLGWYCFRATAEYLDAEASLERAETRIEVDGDTGAALRAAGFLAFDDGTTSTWDAGFDVGAFQMDLDILGSQAAIHLDDFVHDWQGSHEFNEDLEPTFLIKRGRASPSTFEPVTVPCDTPHASLMVERLAALARSKNLAADNARWIRATERTQELLDAAWAAGALPGVD